MTAPRHTLENYEQLGRLLRNARLDQKLNLQDVAHRLHIRHRYLAALEEGELEQLPGDTFVTGYLRRYAMFLGLNEESVVQCYRGIGTLPQRRLLHIPDTLRTAQHPSRRLVAATLLCAFLLATLWEYTHPGRRNMNTSMLPVPQPASSPLPPVACRSAGATWPPCYYRQNRLFSAVGVSPPQRTVMELYTYANRAQEYAPGHDR